jgi:glutathione synthase/RimK-type ligase-like ATP-grasp enzyme
LSKKCFPNLNTCWHYDDKIKQYYLLKSLGYPIADSWIFYDKKHALEWMEDADYPLIFKLKKGAGSNNVILINNKKEAKKIINKMFGKGIVSEERIPHAGKIKYKDIESFIRHKADKYILNKIRGHSLTTWQTEKNYVLFQKYLPNNSFDTRIRVIGNRASAVRRFVRKNDFRASGSGDWDLDHTKIDLEFVDLALRISKELQFQSMGYDFLYDENGKPSICEISYNFPDYIEWGYWDQKLNWHDFKYVPPFLHLMHALDFKDLKHPDLDSISHLLH